MLSGHCPSQVPPQRKARSHRRWATATPQPVAAAEVAASNWATSSSVQRRLLTPAQATSSNWASDDSYAGRRPLSQSPVSDSMITLGSSRSAPVQSGKGAEVAPAKEDPVILGSWATVHFCLKFKTNFGQGIRLLGSHPKLGNWNLRQAVEMRWTPGDCWMATVLLPAGGVYEYKYVLIDYESKQALEWQLGSNAVLAVVVSETEVKVVDNWSNSPGAMVQVNEESMTRETKLQKWATDMMGYWKESRRLQIELAQKNAETQAMRNELAQLRMELSLERQARLEQEAQVMDLQVENASLQSQLVQKTVELNNTLAEVLQLLDRELMDDDLLTEGDLSGAPLGEEDDDVYYEEEFVGDEYEVEPSDDVDDSQQYSYQGRTASNNGAGASNNRNSYGNSGYGATHSGSSSSSNSSGSRSGGNGSGSSSSSNGQNGAGKGNAHVSRDGNGDGRSYFIGNPAPRNTMYVNGSAAPQPGAPGSARVGAVSSTNNGSSTPGQASKTGR